MGSRVRKKPERLFEVFVEIAKPEVDGQAPFVIQQCPNDFDDKEALSMIPKFVYPCPTDASKVDHFTFVLTDIEGMFRFGYCRHSPGHQTCLCILSWLPWCEVFYKMLDLLAEITNRSSGDNNVINFLQATLAQQVPLPKIPVTIVASEDMFSFTAPDTNALPSIHSSRNLTEYYNAVDPSNMMHIFASMLHERRIFMTSKKLSRLTSCIHAAEALLYPMHWQHLYIPVLPAHLIDYISAPMPYLIGVHSNLMEKLTLNRVDVGDAVVVDLDENTVTTEYDDLGDLPEDVSTYLKRNLKTDVIKNSMMKNGDAISMAFLQALVRLIGGYRDALKLRAGEPITFDPEAFVQSRTSQSTQAFLEGMLTLQIFQQFIYGRLEILNAGDGFVDIFEQQATLYTDKLTSQSRYEKWLKSVKKSSKKSWSGIREKAAPMMSTAVHSFKEQGKKAMADFKTKISGLTENEEKKTEVFQPTGGIVHSRKIRDRPYTTHETSTPERPARPPAPKTGENRSSGQLRPKSADVADLALDDSQLRLSYHTIDVNLIGDRDIEAFLMRSASAEMLPNHNQPQQQQQQSDSSESCSSPSSESLADEDKGNIPFKALESSDEDEQKKVETKLQGQSPTLGQEDRLIVGKPPPRPPPKGNNLSPVAPPRPKKRLTPTSSPQASPGLEHRSPFDDKSPTATKPPVPLPRQASLRSPKSSAEPPSTALVQEAPLIKFDSSDSTDSVIFDPLASSTSPAGNSHSDGHFGPDISPRPSEVEKNHQETSPPLVRGQSSRTSLTRRKGVRKESIIVPKRQSYKDDSPEKESTDIFDPLAGSGTISATSSSSATTSTALSVRADPLASHSPRRESSDLLMHEWSLASLAKGPVVSLPGSVNPHLPTRSSHPTNPFMPVGGGSGQRPISQVGQSLPVAPLMGLNPQRVAGPGGVQNSTGPDRMTFTQQRHQQMPLHGLGTSSHPPPGGVVPNKLPPSMFSAFGPPASSSMSSTVQAGNNMPRHPAAQTHAPNFPAPTPSSSSPFIHGGGVHHMQAAPQPSPDTRPPLPPRSANSITTPACAQAPLRPSPTYISKPGTSTQNKTNQADIFSDLMDIDFSASVPGQNLPTSQNTSVIQTQKNNSSTISTKVPPARPPQPKWETFD